MTEVAKDDGTAPQPAPATASGDKPVDARLLELLVCPLTKTALSYDPVRGELVSRAARLAFPIRDGVPLMTPEAARPWDGE